MRALVASELLGQPVQSDILDAGSGDGGVSRQFLGSNNRITLLDFSENMLARARAAIPEPQRLQVKLVCQPLESFEAAEAYDVVLCLGVLAHVQSVDQTLTTLATWLRPDGRALVQFTDPDRLAARISHRIYTDRDGRGYRLNRTAYPDLLASFERSGLAVRDQRRYSLLIPGMGRLPDSWLFRFQRLTLHQRWLSRHGSEVVVLLGKG
jgi:SAM-dependent methyltransferase